MTFVAGNIGGGTSCGFAGLRERQNAQPRLDAVADKGGFALSMSLQPNSLAIDGGVGACPATDARGVVCPQNDRCDTGAFESAQAQDFWCWLMHSPRRVHAKGALPRRQSPFCVYSASTTDNRDG